MTSTNWHVPASLLARLAADPENLDSIAAASVEAHVVVCAHCRDRLRDGAAPAMLDRSWAAVADVVDQPQATLVERLLDRLGLADGLARVLAATPALRAAGLLAITFSSVGAAVAARVADVDGPFLVVAPLVPLAAVAVSFAAISEPAGEAAVASPLWGAGLALRRVMGVLAVTFAVLGVGSLISPGVGIRSVAWVLPGLALGLGALGLSTWIRAEVAVATLAGGWGSVVLWANWHTGRDGAFVDSVVFGPTGQLVALAVVVIAAVVVVTRRGRFTTLESFR